MNNRFQQISIILISSILRRMIQSQKNFNSLCYWESDIGDKEQEEEYHAYVFPKYWLYLHSLTSLWFCPDALNGCSSRVSFWGWESANLALRHPDTHCLQALFKISYHRATSALLASTATIYRPPACLLRSRIFNSAFNNNENNNANGNMNDTINGP